jgi:hypothetical protein
MQSNAAFTWLYTKVGLMGTSKIIFKIKINDKRLDQNHMQGLILGKVLEIILHPYKLCTHHVGLHNDIHKVCCGMFNILHPPLLVWFMFEFQLRSLEFQVSTSC